MIALATVKAPRIGVTVEVGDDLRIYVDAQPEFHDAVLRLVRVIDDGGEWVRDYDVPASVEGVAHELARALGADAEVSFADALYEGWEGDIVLPDPEELAAEQRALRAARARMLSRDSGQPRCSDLEEGKPGRYTNEDGQGCDGAEGGAGGKASSNVPPADDVDESFVAEDPRHPGEAVLPDGSRVPVTMYTTRSYYETPADYHEALRKRREEEWGDGGPTPEMVKGFQAFVDDAQVAVQVNGDLLDEILAGGFRNQFQTNTSRGALNPAARAFVEGDIWGYPTDLDGAKRPIYGFMYRAANDGPVTQYGDTTLILKDHVRAHTTVMDGDSLSYHDHARPAPIDRVDELAVRRRARRNAVTGEKWHYDTSDDWHRASFTSMYVEAQIHRPLTMDDVAEIRFLGDSPSPWIDNSVLKDLRTRYPDIKFKAHNGQDLTDSIDIRAGMA